ncbi:MAG: hypothetical protein ACOVNQ_09685, partial [Pirellula sp.]
MAKNTESIFLIMEVLWFMVASYQSLLLIPSPLGHKPFTDSQDESPRILYSSEYPLVYWHLKSRNHLPGKFMAKFDWPICEHQCL